MAVLFAFLERIADFAEKDDGFVFWGRSSFAGFFFFLFHFFSFFADAGEELNHQEDYEGNDEEVDDVLNEVAVV